MSKLLSKISIASIAIAAVVGGTMYLTSTPDQNKIVSTNSAVAKDHNAVALASVWDQETEPDYSGTLEMTVYRSPSCGCCGVWIEHAKKHGFKIKDIKTESMEALKQKYNVPPELVSCHTTIIDGNVMEGHIPADDIKRFLEQKPELTSDPSEVSSLWERASLAGLAVPGMPLGTPGMEAGDLKQPFQVLAFNDLGEVEVFQEYQSY